MKTLQKFLIPLVIILTGLIVVAQVRGENLFIEKKVPGEISDANDDENVLHETNDDPWYEMEKLFKNFDGANKISYQGKITMFPEDGNDQIEQIPYRCVINGPDYHYILDSVEMIYSKGIALNIFHRDQIMMLARQKMQKNNWFSLASMDSLKSYLQMHEGDIKVLQGKGSKILSVEGTGEGDIYKYEIHYLPETYHIQKIAMFFSSLEDFSGEDNGDDQAQKNQDLTNPEEVIDNGAGIYFNVYRVEMSFDRFNMEVLDLAFAPEQIYIDTKKGKAKVHEQYREYRIITPGKEN